MDEEPIYATIDKPRPVTTVNLARRSVIQYYAVPATPSTLSSMEELDRISLSTSNGSLSNSGEPSLRSSPVTFSSQPPPNVPAPTSLRRRNYEVRDDFATIARCEQQFEKPLIVIQAPPRRISTGTLPEMSDSGYNLGNGPSTPATSPAALLQPNNGSSSFFQINNSSRNSQSGDMTSPRSKSPRPNTPKSADKEESFWDKFGTTARKKKIKEVQVVEEEGKRAIDLPGSPSPFDISPEDYNLADGEERLLIERRSYDDPKLGHLIKLLTDWINDELADQRIIVMKIDDDLYDGQVLQKLLEKLTGQKLEVPEVSQSEEGQRHKLEVVLGAANQIIGLNRWSAEKWSVESIHSKSLVAILYLLVHLARHFRAPLRLPENVNVETIVIKKRNGKLEYRRVTEELTSTYDELGMRCERDAFDALLDTAPDKLQVVKKSLLSFVNKQLIKVNLKVYEIESQFHDCVYLVLLMGLLENYFVPLGDFHLTPKDFEQKVFNVAFSFELMQDAGLSKPKARPEDIVNSDFKSTLRVLYNLFAKYRNAE